MEDMERYGDYNEVDDEPAEGKRNIVGILLKILVAVVCIAVIGVLAFRIFIFNTYPEEVSGLMYTEGLAEFAEKNGTVEAFTQTSSIKYDDPKEGNFFFDKLILVPDADHIQFTVRYNRSLMQSIIDKHSIIFDDAASPTDMFTFTLVRTVPGYTPPEDGTVEPLPVECVGELTVLKHTSSFVYEYVRLGFDGVDFGLDEGETPVGWYRLDITVNGAHMKSPYSLPVYQYSIPLEVYTLSEAEVAK